MRDDAVQAQILTPTGMRFFALSCTFQSSYLTKVFASAFVMLIVVGEGMLRVGRYNIGCLPSLLPFLLNIPFHHNQILPNYQQQNLFSSNLRIIISTMRFSILAFAASLATLATTSPLINHKPTINTTTPFYLLTTTSPTFSKNSSSLPNVSLTTLFDPYYQPNYLLRLIAPGYGSVPTHQAKDPMALAITSSTAVKYIQPLNCSLKQTMRAKGI
jgi:hypothetical protein